MNETRSLPLTLDELIAALTERMLDSTALGGEPPDLVVGYTLGLEFALRLLCAADTGGMHRGPMTAGNCTRCGAPFVTEREPQI